MPRELITVNDLTKEFVLSTKQRKLNNTSEKVKIAANKLNFSVYEGEVFGLLGPNGAGKTTTLRMLSTLIKPTSGEAFVDGASIVREPDRVRSRIGFLTSELKLEQFFTPDYLFDFFADLHGVPADVAKARKAEMFSRFGINEFAGVKVANLSTGMKQKASLVISLVHDPDVVIFDEPTNGLDIITAKTVTDFLLDLKAEKKTVMISTHIFSLVEKLCDRVGIIIDGKMAVCDSLDAVCGGISLEDRFFELYNDAKEAAK
ncbi:MAG: ABC transporter ATP-binding protein [Clostridia bacterium]|nr:ABC transporter ATP-binding protein [Clostridia bacterium]